MGKIMNLPHRQGNPSLNLQLVKAQYPVLPRMLLARCVDSPSDFLATSSRMCRKVILYLLMYKRRFIVEMFSALSAVFLLGWASVSFVLPYSAFILLPSFDFRDFNKQPTTATATSNAGVDTRYNSLFISLHAVLHKNNNLKWSNSAYSRDRKLQRPNFFKF